jgi:hypothetical protein
MPRFFCLRHLEQYYREKIQDYDLFALYCRQGLFKVVDEKECEHCKVGVPFFEISLGKQSQEVSRISASD